MAPNPITQTLHLLLPTLDPLPAELTALASSLLAQSKIKAARLKPEEEAARTFACCDLAVERLQGRLGLERATEARPPVGGRVYGKLRGFLDKVLAGPMTPRRGGGARNDGKGKMPESRPTSLRKKWAEERKIKVEAQESGKLGGRVKRRKPERLEAPGYTYPVIRALCEGVEVERTRVAPHVFTAVSVVVREFGRKQADEDVGGSGGKRKRGSAVGDDEEAAQAGLVREDDIPSVIVTLFLAVVRRMYGVNKVEKVEKKAIRLAADFAAGDGNGFPDAASEESFFEDGLQRWESQLDTWTQLEWFDNVPEAIEADDQDIAEDETEDVEMADAVGTPVGRKRPAKTPLWRKEKHRKFHAAGDEEDVVGRAGLLPGLGTMFQPAVDWLSEERVADFKRWEREVRKECAMIEGRA